MLECLIETETAFDENDSKADEARKTSRRAAMLKAVSLGGHVVALRDLSSAMKTLVALERQALNLDAALPDDPEAGPKDVADAVVAKIHGRLNPLAAG